MGRQTGGAEEARRRRRGGTEEAQEVAANGRLQNRQDAETTCMKKAVRKSVVHMEAGVVLVYYPVRTFPPEEAALKCAALTSSEMLSSFSSASPSLLSSSRWITSVR